MSFAKHVHQTQQPHVVNKELEHFGDENVLLEPHLGVMVSVFISSAVYRGFDPRQGQTKHFKIGICCFSAKHATLRRKSK